MKQLLVLGAGQSASYLLAQLLEDAERENWFVTVGDLDEGLARRAVGTHPRAEAVRFDVNDAELRSTRIEHADVVINILPAAYQDLVAWDCVNHGRHMMSVSYRDQAVRDLDLDAKRKGVLLLCEMGLDPGIDHMSTMSLIQQVRDNGGRIVGFCSYGAGIPAPEEGLSGVRPLIAGGVNNLLVKVGKKPSTVTPYELNLFMIWRANASAALSFFLVRVNPRRVGV